MKNIGKIIFVIMGSVVGAGFISGQEIYTFFVQYGYSGFIGVFIMSVLMGAVLNASCQIIWENHVKEYKMFLESIFPYQWKYTKKGMEKLVYFFLFITFLVMCSALAVFLWEQYQIKKWLGGLVTGIVCFYIFQKNIKIITKINEIVMPSILVMLTFLIPKTMISVLPEGNMVAAIGNSILYVSYNSILVIPILVKMEPFFESKKQIRMATSICSLLMMGMASLVFFFIIPQTNTSHVELPLWKGVQQLGRIEQIGYQIALVMAIGTSIILSGYGFLGSFKKKNFLYIGVTLLVCSSIPFFCYFSFSGMIQVLYPIFGFLGLLQMFFILKY